MSNYGIIKFNYEGPSIDIKNCSGSYSDGTINTKYTLQSLKNLLQNNIKVIDKLLSLNDHVGNLIVCDDDVTIEITSDDIFTQLVNEEILLNINRDDDIHSSNETETNQDRLNRILNMTNINESDNIFGNVSDNSDLDDSDDIDDTELNYLPTDQRALKFIVDSFDKLVKFDPTQDSDSDSDSD
ncbi:hypothetical protein QKC54_gp0602 [Megavirus baoshan]|uniref:Uncharacterized protein n=1 Tax=Megavirus baoshan TaxID=2496520 RepID=A0A3Q8U7V4_9VIRU|nr:hypothetical protein QKC54_gp0602 [Megavirus baoshan]AZL89233.1 hypothetical protein Mb0470 [Megavirus baoshan]